MFNLFGDSTFGQAANTALNSGLGNNPMGSLAEYMNNIYGSGQNYNLKGMKLDSQDPENYIRPAPFQLPGVKDAGQGLAALNSPSTGGGQPTGIDPQMAMSLLALL